MKIVPAEHRQPLSKGHLYGNLSMMVDPRPGVFVPISFWFPSCSMGFWNISETCCESSAGFGREQDDS